MIIAFIFQTSNALSIVFASFKFEINGIVSSIKLSVDFFFFILIPLCGIQYTINKNESATFKSLLFDSCCAIVIVVSLVQVLLMFGIRNVITDYYSAEIFKYLEGSWDGIPSIISNALLEFRIKSTFHEPSVLATFLLLYTFPFMLCRYLNGVYSFNKIIDTLFIILPFGCLLFSFSTTSYIVASIDLLIVFFISLSKKISIKHFLVIALIIAGIIYFVATYYQTYSKIVNRIFMYKNDKSSSTRIGSIVGAINLFNDNPLGVGYTNEKYVLYNYLPYWGITNETTQDRSNIQSSFLRFLSDFGISWIVFCIAGLITIWLSYRKKKKYLLRWQKESLFLWLFNFLLSASFGTIEYHCQWFLFSALIIIGPIFKNFNINPSLVILQTNQPKKVL